MERGAQGVRKKTTLIKQIEFSLSKDGESPGVTEVSFLGCKRKTNQTLKEKLEGPWKV